MKTRLSWIALVGVALAGVVVSGQGARAEDAAKKASFSRDEEPYRDNAPANPRIQMLWRTTEDEPFGIWSVTLDGKDLRPVVAPSVLFSGEAQEVKSPVRSPNGRYIACRGFTKDNVQTRFLVDRKTRTVKTIMADAWGEAEFNWSPDSRHLYFYGGGSMWDYDVMKGTQRKMPFIGASKLRLVEGGKRFLAALMAGVEYRSLDGKLLSSKKLPKPAGGVVSISNSGKRIIYDTETTFVVSPATPEKQILEFDRAISSAVFTPDDSVIIAPSAGYLVRIDVVTGKIENMLPMSGNPMIDLTRTER